MSEKRKNLIVSLIFLAFGIFLFLQSLDIKHMMKNDVGSAFFPKVIAICMIVVSIIRLFMSLREKEQKIKNAESDCFGGVATIILIGAYVLMFNSVGFLISTAIYLFLQMLILTPVNKRKFPILIGVSLIAPTFIYTMFVYIINIPLPKGIFGF